MQGGRRANLACGPGLRDALSRWVGVYAALAAELPVKARQEGLDDRRVSEPDDGYSPDPDDLTRAELAELAHLPWSDLAEVLDEWLHREHGVTSSHHHVGLFLELLSERGWQVTRVEPIPPIGQLPPPTE